MVASHNTWIVALSEATGLTPKQIRRVAGCQISNRQYLPDPKGFYVYFLVSKTEGILYVGKSRNLYARLGQHMQDETKLSDVDRIEFVRCGSSAQMDKVEKLAIVALAPPKNKTHNPFYRRS